MKPEDLVLGTEYEVLYQNRWERARLVVVHKRLQLRVPYDATKISSSFEFDWSFSNGIRRTTMTENDVAKFARAVPAMAPILPDDVGRLKLELAEAEAKITALEKAIESQKQTIRRQEDTIETHSKTLSETRNAMGCGFGQDIREVAKTLLGYKEELAKRQPKRVTDYYEKTARDLSDVISLIRDAVNSYESFDQLVNHCREHRSDSDRLKKLLALMKEGV